MDKQLRKLNFAPGIKAKDINANFDLIHSWITQERKHTGGYGIEQGFDTVVDLDRFTISVADGVVVTPDGEERHISGAVFDAGQPEYIARKEKLPCPIDGVLTLSDRPYSPNETRYKDYIAARKGDTCNKAEFSIYCEVENRDVYPLQIDGYKVYVSNASDWANKILEIKYYTAEDRVDAILLNPDGTYLYQKSIISTNPSHVDIQDYEKGTMMIAVIHWTIDTDGVNAKIYTNHRTYREVYVDDDNRLYLNGKPYSEAKNIYFEEPEEPKDEDMWYDKPSNTLMVWREMYGDYGWVRVNDDSTILVKEIKLIKPEEWPSDCQTFLFGKDETNLRFVPNTNSLDVCIDNIPLMVDQFEEIVETANGSAPDYMAQGVGFKLKDPMDRAAYLQVTVTHQVRMKPVRQTFQRAAIFVDESYSRYSINNKKRVFKTLHPYVVGAKQLEVWVDGRHLVPGQDLIEMVDSLNDASEEDLKKESVMSNYFRISETYPELQDESFVSYRVSKYVWSYDQVAGLLGETTDDIRELKRECKALTDDLSMTNGNVAHRLDEMEKKVDAVTTKASTDITASLKQGAITIPLLEPAARRKLLGGIIIDKSMPATEIDLLPGMKSTDFLQVFIISKDENRILIKGVDYTLADTENGLRIDLNTEYGVSGNTIYATGFSIGA